MTLFRFQFVLLLPALFLAGCAKDQIYADVIESPAGRTFLVVSRKAPCPTVMIDGSAWKTPRDKPVEIAPGRHDISCGSDDAVSFDVQQGTTVVIYGWGP